MGALPEEPIIISHLKTSVNFGVSRLSTTIWQFPIDASPHSWALMDRLATIKMCVPLNVNPWSRLCG